MRITIFSLGGLLGQYVTNTALLHGAQVTAYVPDAKAIWPRKNMTVIEGSLQNRERVLEALLEADAVISVLTCLLYTSPSPLDRSLSRMPSSA